MTPRVIEHVEVLEQPQIMNLNARIPTTLFAIGALFLAVQPSLAADVPTVRVGQERYALLPKRTPSAFNLALTITPHPDSPNGTVRLLFGYQDEKNCYRATLSQQGCGLDKLVAGKAIALHAAKSSVPLKPPFRISIKRRPLLLTVVVNGRVAAQAFDTTYGAGKAAVEVTKGMPKVTRPSVQKCATISVADDFMVEVDESVVQETVDKRTTAIAETDTKNLREWSVVSGAWQLHSVMEEVLEAENPLLRERIAASAQKPDALRSANPFSMEGKSKGTGIAVMGHSFWDDYAASVSVNSSGSQFGLVFYYRDRKDYFVLRWRCLSVRDKPQPIELVRVSPKGAKVLARAFASAKINQWYRLSVCAFGRHARAYLDGARLFDVAHDEMTGGKVGLYTRGENSTHFDDVTIDSTDSFPLDSAALLRAAATFAAKGWQIVGQPRVGASLKALQADPGAAEVGPVLSSGMLISSLVRVPAGSASSPAARNVEIRFGGDGAWVTFEWAESPGGKSVVQRLRYRKGNTERALCEAAAGPLSGKTRRIELDLTEAPLAKVYVDGVLELRRRLPGPVSGRFSFVARGASGARFSGIRIHSRRPEDLERLPSNIVFADDPYMLHWSAPQGAWVPAGNMTQFWHKGDFLGRFSVAMPFLDGAQLLFCTNRTTPNSDPKAPLEPRRGYALTLRAATRTIQFDRLGKTIKSIPLGASSASLPAVKVHRDGKYVWLTAEERELFAYRDASPPTGTKLALKAKGTLKAEDFAQFQVSRAQVRDDYFDRTPTDWRRVGKWEVTNRFTCDPRWSHLAGMSDGGCAILWNKTEYDGDLTIEFYAGHRMRLHDVWETPLYYPRVGDINVTCSADGRNLDTGYTVTLSGWDRTWSEKWTRLWRSGKVVAQSDRELVPRNREVFPSRRVIEVPWIKKGRAIHGAWYYIKLRKLGNRIEYYFDNELVLSYEDPRPLSGRHIALWTYDSAVMFARAKVSYSRKPAHVPTVQMRSAKAPASMAVEGLFSGDTGPAARLVSRTHPGRPFTFERSLEEWSNVGGEEGAFLALDRGTAAAGQSSLRVTNIETGGSFGVRVPVRGMRLSGTKLEFDYRVPPSVKVNLYLKLEDPYDRWYFVRLTGESAASVTRVRLGSIARARADGRWRTAAFDLGDALAAVRPNDPDMRLEEMRIGNFHEGYLAAGMGGNHKGDSYHLDNFRAFTPAGAPVRVELRSKPTPPNVAFTVSRHPAPRRVARQTPRSPNGVFANVRSGQWYVHAWENAATPKAKIVASLPIEVVASPLKVGKVLPSPGSAWGGNTVYVCLAPSAGPNLDSASLRLLINGHALDTGSLAVQYSHSKRRISIDPSLARVSFKDGEKVTFEFHARDTDGRPVDHTWAYQMKRSLDRSGPTLVRLVDYPLHNTFEHTLAPCENAWERGGAEVSLNASDGSKGNGCLRGVNLAVAGPSGIALYPRPFNAGRFPILSFDYRIPKEYHLDIVIDPAGRRRNIQLTDTDRANAPISKVPDAAADDKWHHAEVNLASALRTRPFDPKLFDLSSALLIDTDYRGVGPNMQFHIDNLQLVPTVSGTRGVRLRWEAFDPSGIKEIRYRWSKYPIRSTSYALGTDETEKTFFVAEEGDRYFHLQARDSNGRSSDVQHYRFLIDNTPPQWGTPSPAPATRSAATTVAIPATDSGSGVDISALGLRVNGRDFSADSSALTYDFKTGKLVWDWNAAGCEPVPNGARIACSAGPLRDFAGNVSPRIEWDWQMDYSRDTVPPSALSVSCPSHRVLMFDTYEESTGDWLLRSLNMYTTAVYRTLRASNPRNYCIRIYDYRRNELLATARTQPYDLYTYPIVSFEYKLATDTDIDWIFQIDGKPYRVRMTPSGSGPKTIGYVPNVVADSQWHATSFDLGAFVRKILPNAKRPQVEMVSLGTFNLDTQRTRKYVYFDNLMISGPGAAKAKFRLSARDITGISGYAYRIDKRIGTVPETNAIATRSGAIEVGPLKPGLWHIHCRSRDGAGLWGGTFHYPYYVGGQAK